MGLFCIKYGCYLTGINRRRQYFVSEFVILGKNEWRENNSPGGGIFREN